jgi:tripartite-type tricarboxylate transporter receptor subunit TctC
MRYSKLLTSLGLVGALSALIMAAEPALAQDDYPARPVEFVVPWGAGGGSDQLARLVASQLESILGVGVPVVNVPGGTGATGMANLLSKPADGYAMAIYIADSHALLAGSNPSWTMEDITPVAVMMQVPSFIFVPADSPYKTWADFKKAAQASPDHLKIATLGFGSVDDFSIKSLNDIKVVQVPFSKPSERYISILGGHADALYEQAGDIRQFLDGGKMRPIMVFGKERFKAFPDVPSSYELGYKIALPQFRSIVVRANTPPERIKALSDALTQVVKSEEFQKFQEAQYSDPAGFLTGDEAVQFVRQQLDDMRQAISGTPGESSKGAAAPQK